MSVKFNEWKSTEHIPTAVKNMVNFIGEKIGYGQVFYENEETVISMYNRGGYAYGYAKGFSISHCTSSYADGPGVDYSSAFVKWIKGLGFRIENSYGDNGMDSATNWHDTYWHYDFVYEKSEIDIDRLDFEDDEESEEVLAIDHHSSY